LDQARRGLRSISPDPSRTYTSDEDQRLAENLRTITTRVYAGEFLREPLATKLLCFFHEQFFKGVRPHAGKHRSSEYGTEFLSFGPNRSLPRAQVPEALARVFAKVQTSVASFDANLTDRSYDESALRLAAWTHAEHIRIHPFEDGNGRTCRLFMNSILIRVGLRPIQFEVPKQEYLNCLNWYYATGDIRPLEALCLRIYPVA